MFDSHGFRALSLIIGIVSLITIATFFVRCSQAERQVIEKDADKIVNDIIEKELGD